MIFERIILTLTVIFCINYASTSYSQTYSTHQYLQIRVIIPAFCKIQSSSASNKLLQNEISMTCNDRGAKIIQIENSLLRLAENQDCLESQSAFQIEGFIKDKRLFVCGESDQKALISIYTL